MFARDHLHGEKNGRGIGVRLNTVQNNVEKWQLNHEYAMAFESGLTE